MRVSTNWLKDYVDIDVTLNELADKMLQVGNEVESLSKISDSSMLVVGYVVNRENHPDSGHLNICDVNLGDEVKRIVCGASNVDAGQKVIVALPGAKLPNGIEIKKVTIRGVESNGMICALEELGIESKYIPEASKGGIHVLDSDALVGCDALKYLCYDDSVIEYELTADRSDLLSMIGMAYETGAILNKKVNLPFIELNEIEELTKDYINIEKTTDNCPIYLSRLVKNVVIKESPNFIKARLMAAGIRPINNLVDISNYVMIEYGQPLHFFDYDKLGNKIIVRMATEDEEVITLDKERRKLNKDDIVITNPNEVVALAGVMGNLSTEITNDTKNILIESAMFNPLNVRYTSKRVLRSEASMRFEKGINPDNCKEALDRAAYLLQKYASGEVTSGIAGYDDFKREEKNISINTEKINKVLGMDIKTEEISDIFERLGFEYELDNNNFKVTVPIRRLDINIKEDLIEEVGRIHGYNNMVGKLPTSKVKKGTYSSKYKYIKNIHKRLQSLGLNEIITYSLTNNEDINKFTNDKFDHIELLSPISEDKKILRYSLIPSLLKVVDYNISRNVKDVMIYEIGKSYYKSNDEYNEDSKLSIAITGSLIENNWQQNKTTCDYYLLKGIVENLFNYLGLHNRYKINNSDNLPKEFHPGKTAEITLDNEMIGYIGCVHPNVSKNSIYVCEIDIEKLFNSKIRNIKYKDIPKYPSIVKDAAFIFNKSIKSIDITNEIKKSGGKIVSDIDIFDIYEGENIGRDKKSIAFKITFMDLNKTLTDDEVNLVFSNIIKNVETKFNAELRNK